MKITRSRLRFLIKEALDDLEKKTQADLRLAGLDIPDDELESYLDQGTSTHYDDFIEKYKKAMSAINSSGDPLHVTGDKKIASLVKDALKSAPEAMISSDEYKDLYDELYSYAYSLHKDPIDIPVLGHIQDYFGLTTRDEKAFQDQMRDIKKPTYWERREKDDQESREKEISDLGKKYDYKPVSGFKLFLDDPEAALLLKHHDYNKSLEAQQKMIDKRDQKDQEIAIQGIEKEMKAKEKQNKLKQRQQRMQKQKQ